MKNSLYKFNVKDITEIAILSALAILLDRFIRIPLAATGGSINIALVPIFIIGLRHGWFKCFISGAIIFGLTTCLIDGYDIATYPLEYFVAFGSCCIIGLFAKPLYNIYLNKKNGKVFAIFFIFLSVILWGVIRLICATLDSIIIYHYTLIPALAYNLTYILPSCIIDGIIISILFPFIIMINKTFKTSFIE